MNSELHPPLRVAVSYESMLAQAGESSSVAVCLVQVERVRVYLIGLGLTALLLALCFPAALPGMSRGWWLLAHVALVPASLVAIGAGRVGRLVWTSYLVSWVWWLIMIRWLVPVTSVGYVVLAGFLAIYLPAFLVVFRLLNLCLRLPAALALPLAWVSLEFLRGTWPAGGFAWFMLGHSQAPSEAGQGGGLFMQVADILGDYGVSFLLAMTNGLVVDGLTLAVDRRGAGGHRYMNTRLKAAAAMWLVSLAAVLVYGFFRIRDVEAATTPSLRIAVVQTAVPQSNKVSKNPGQIDADWQRLLALTRQAAATEPPVDLVIWPETVVPASINPEAVGYYRERAEALMLRPIKDRARAERADLVEQFERAADYHQVIVEFVRDELKTALLVGSSTDLFGTPPSRFNTAYLYRSDGTRSPLRYDKIHRVPFGEYIPWVDGSPRIKRLFLRYLSPYDHDYTLTPGRSTTVFETGGSGAASVRLVTPICFEDTDGRLCRRMIFGNKGRKRAEVMANLTNDAWFGPPQRPQHLQIAVFRSVENRVPTARSVNMGVSGFISATGRIGPTRPWRGPDACGEGIVVHQVGICSKETIFGGIGHAPIGVMATMTAGLTLLALVVRKKNWGG